MLSIVNEMAESGIDEQTIFIKVLVLGLMAIISLLFVYNNIKNH